MKTINVGLLGFGNVSKGTYDILQMNKDLITQKNNAVIEVTKVLFRTPEKAAASNLPKQITTQDINDIINDPSIDVVVEAMGGLEPATSYMIAAMKNGKHVVSANKAAIANSFEELQQTASVNNVQFKIEASVGGAIPALTTILEPLSGNEITEVRGIVNGTTNYILTKMTDLGLAYSDVLKEAQEKGFAEADPTADVEGLDVANKLSILMCLAFGEYVHPDNIPTTGISKISMEDIEKAKKENSKIKLIAYASKSNGKLEYYVKPMFIGLNEPLAGVSNEFNAIFLKGNAFDEIMLYGKGAGPLPTGSAVVGDILSICRSK